MCFFRYYAAAAPDPLDPGEPDEERVVGNARVHKLVDEICSMNLLEIADLTELLRKKLGIPASGGMYAMGKSFPDTEHGSFSAKWCWSLCFGHAYHDLSQEVHMCGPQDEVRHLRSGYMCPV